MRLFRALTIRNYRVMFFGSFIAHTGTWMHRVAQDWLVVELSDGSPEALGLVAAVQFLPLPLVGLFAGLLVDRVDKRYVLAAAVAVQLLVTIAISVLVLTATMTLAALAALSFVFGVATAFELPSRQSFVTELVPNPLVSNAVSLNSLSFNIGRSVGPAVAGFLLATVWNEVGPLYLVFCASTLATFVSLLLLRARDFVDRVVAPRGSSIGQALRYVRERPDLSLAVVVILFAGLFCLNFQVLIAMLARHDLAIGAGTFGVLSSVLAVGAMAGAVTAASLPRPRLRLLTISSAVLGMLVATAALSPTPLVLGIVLVPLGFTALLVLTSSNAVMQLAAPPTMRGRLMSVYVVVMFSGTPLGAPVVGYLGGLIGARWAIASGGIALTIATIVAALVCLKRLERRPPTTETD
ncbi:MFS transporter [Microbacterium tumbae]